MKNSIFYYSGDIIPFMSAEVQGRDISKDFTEPEFNLDLRRIGDPAFKDYLRNIEETLVPSEEEGFFDLKKSLKGALPHIQPIYVGSSQQMSTTIERIRPINTYGFLNVAEAVLDPRDIDNLSGNPQLDRRSMFKVLTYLYVRMDPARFEGNKIKVDEVLGQVAELWGRDPMAKEFKDQQEKVRESLGKELYGNILAEFIDEINKNGVVMPDDSYPESKKAKDYLGKIPNHQPKNYRGISSKDLSAHSADLKNQYPDWQIGSQEVVSDRKHKLPEGFINVVGFVDAVYRKTPQKFEGAVYRNLLEKYDRLADEASPRDLILAMNTCIAKLESLKARITDSSEKDKIDLEIIFKMVKGAVIKAAVHEELAYRRDNPVNQIDFEKTLEAEEEQLID